MSLIAKKKLTQNVVAVNCGERYGTAFFISNNQLLTARHVVVENLEDPDIPVYISVDAQIYECDATQLGAIGEKLDVAILRPKVNIATDIGLKLVAADLNEEMSLITHGFPKEIGCFLTSIPLNLKYICEVTTDVADIILANGSQISFVSYNGYSGAPVVNVHGNVCAILAIQENNNLRAVSIRKLRTALSKHNIDYSADCLFEDDSHTGLLRCKSILETAISRAGDKYSPDVHQDNDLLNNKFNDFINPKADLALNIEIDKAVDWCSKHPKLFGKKYSERHTLQAVTDYLQSIQYLEFSVIDKLTYEEKKLRSQAIQLHSSLNQLLFLSKFSKKRIFGIFGAAGVGKSHMTCQLGLLYNKSGHYVYYFHGSDLRANVDIEGQIKTVLQFDDESLLLINEEAKKRNKRVLFIIDAVNEGPGFKYFQNQINKLLLFFRKFDSFKLLVTGRRSGTGIYEVLRKYQDDSFTFELEGFQNVEVAISDFAKKYGVDEQWLYKVSMGIDFSNPLLLSMVCKSYSLKPFLKPETLTRLNIYSEYLTSRNETISEVVDEDPARNITLKAIKEIAKYSAFHKDCGRLEKKKAYKICNKIAYRRDWNRNLLKMLIEENILYSLNDSLEYDNQLVDLEFQNFGDVFRAAAFLDSKVPIEKTIFDLYNKSLNDFINEENTVNCISAIIGLGNPEAISTETIEKLPEEIIFEALRYHNIPLSKKIEELYIPKIEEMRIEDISKFIDFFSVEFFNRYDAYLDSLPQNIRDKINILSVNKPYELLGISTLPSINSKTYKTSKEIAYKRIVYFSWLYSSSHPEYRSLLLRHTVRMLNIYPELCYDLIGKFCLVDDAYILSNVLCSIYGTLLITRDTDTATKCSKIIYEKFYSQASLYPRNLLVRQWSLQILEFTEYLNPSFNRLSSIEFPLSNTENPLKWNLSDVDEESIFGSTPGGERLRYNLFPSWPLSSDFNRYVIGTNNYATSPDFFISEKEGIPLADIEKMVALEVKNIGWDDELGAIDTMAPPFERNNNKKEKICKKYLWIAYQNIMALLSDHCFSSLEISDSNQKKIGAKPWMVRGHSLFDPTLLPMSINTLQIPTLEFKPEIEDFNGLMATHGAYPIPIFLLRDDNNNTWLQVDGWDNWYETDGDEVNYGSNFHLQYIGRIVKDWNSNSIEKAIKDNFFHYYIMPLDNEYEFLWNEYPWAERSRVRQYEWKKLPAGEGYAMPVRVGQLQEDMSVIEYEEQPIFNAYAPNWDFMNEMHLYTAERGVVRQISENSIVAYNRSLFEKGCGGLIIRKDILDSYLKSINGVLLIYVDAFKSKGPQNRAHTWYIYSEDNIKILH